MTLYEGNLDAMASMLREAQNETLYYKQKAREPHSPFKEVQGDG